MAAGLETVSHKSLGKYGTNGGPLTITMTRDDCEKEKDNCDDLLSDPVYVYGVWQPLFTFTG